MGVTIIAEAGVNHDGALDRALSLVNVAAEAGADIVKFQTFRAAELAAPSADKAEYQRRTTDAQESQLAMLRRLELDEEAHRVLLARCAEKGVGFLSTPFDLPSLRFLLDGLGQRTIKVSSGDLTNGPLLLEIARSGAAIILSTGMGSLPDIEEALRLLAFGCVDPSGVPGPAGIAAAWESAAGRKALAERVTLLHCTTEYPAPLSEVNLRAMPVLAQHFGLPVGYSDHTEGTDIAVAAVALGARVIEKHFTLDRNLPGPDHKASLEPAELACMVRGIRAVEAALGDGLKAPTASERKNMPIARKSLVALAGISAGETLTEQNLGAKRPGSGISPMEYWNWLGRPADRAYAAGEVIGS